MSSHETLTSIGSLNDEVVLGGKVKRSTRGCEKSVGEELSETPFADPPDAVVSPLMALQERYSLESGPHMMGISKHRRHRGILGFVGRLKRANTL